MALTAFDTSSLLSQAAFYPPPLHIHKKLRRATLRKHIFRKSIHYKPKESSVYGPLDDIIEEIRSNIWELPHDYSCTAPFLDWSASLELPDTWALTPMPISRLPNNRPLTIRKNRESRSSTSSSNMGGTAHPFRNDMREDAFNGGSVTLPATDTAPWPLLDASESYDITQQSSLLDVNTPASPEAFDGTLQSMGDHKLPSKRRPSVLRLLTGLSRLRRTDTGETSVSGGDMSEPLSPTSFETYKEHDVDGASREPSEDAVESYVRKHAHK